MRSPARILFQGAELFGLDERAMRELRGAQISMVFQDARAALNPVFTIGRQLADVWQLQHGGSRADARSKRSRRCGGSTFPNPSGARGSIRTNSPAAWRNAR